MEMKKHIKCTHYNMTVQADQFVEFYGRKLFMTFNQSKESQ